MSLVGCTGWVQPVNSSYHISNLMVLPSGNVTLCDMNAAPTVILELGSNCPRT
jgi:hypothetical protein